MTALLKTLFEKARGVFGARRAREHPTGGPDQSEALSRTNIEQELRRSSGTRWSGTDTPTRPQD